MIKLVWKIENVSVTQGSRILRDPLLLFENLHLLPSSNSNGDGEGTEMLIPSPPNCHSYNLLNYTDMTYISPFV